MSKIISLFIWLKSRLSEPSTMASIAAVSALGKTKTEIDVMFIAAATL